MGKWQSGEMWLDAHYGTVVSFSSMLSIILCDMAHSYQQWPFVDMMQFGSHEMTHRMTHLPVQPTKERKRLTIQRTLKFDDRRLDYICVIWWITLSAAWYRNVAATAWSQRMYTSHSSQYPWLCLVWVNLNGVTWWYGSSFPGKCMHLWSEGAF